MPLPRRGGTPGNSGTARRRSGIIERLNPIAFMFVIADVFDTFTGLPLHILVVHLCVVLLPVVGVLTPAVTIRASWRRLLPWVVGANLAAYLASLVATRSGAKFEARVLKAQHGTGAEAILRHAAKGTWVPWFALGLLVVSVIAYLVVRVGDRAARLLPVVMVLAVGFGALVIYQTVATGDLGSRAAWSQLIANT